MTQLGLFKPFPEGPSISGVLPFHGNGAVFSECRRYRYVLWRVWESSQPLVAFVGLNPSTADELNDDPTIRRCLGFAKRWGHGGMVMLNLFAFRSTSPSVMKAAPDPIGPDNDRAIWNASMAVDVAVAAWGAHGSHLNRGSRLRESWPALQCLGTTKDGHPKHPLYLPSDVELIPLGKP